MEPTSTGYVSATGASDSKLMWRNISSLSWQYVLGEMYTSVVRHAVSGWPTLEAL
jgi:hypothetical protein